MPMIFCLGFIGPKEEAEEIKRQLGTFLQERLKLELSQDQNAHYPCAYGNCKVSGLSHLYLPAQRCT